MPACELLVSAGCIVTQNRQREVIRNGALAIDNGRIVAIGPTSAIRDQWQAPGILDYPQGLLLPGLINSHTHAAMTFLRGAAEDMPLMQWLTQCVFPAESRLVPEIVRLGSLLGYAEMLASGTTACVDMYIFEEAVLSAAHEAGIRCLGGEAVFNFPSAACRDWREALDRTGELAAHYASHPRIGVAVNPHSVYTTTPEILEACRRLALEEDLPLHIHLAETREETRQSLEAWGKRPVAWCVQNGLFDCTVIAAHLVDITEDEARYLASRNVVGVHNPASNMKLSSGVAPMPLLRSCGVSLGLGTDGPASNNTLNMFAEMRMAGLLHKLGGADFLTAQQILDMATLGGARALGEPSVGALEVGKWADCAILDAQAPSMLPLHDPVAQIVYAANGGECRLTMVAGEILYRDGKFTRLDYGALCDEVEKLRDFAGTTRR